MEYTIRPAALEEAPLVTAHRRAMFDAMQLAAPQVLDQADANFLPWVQDKMAKGEYLHWFAEDEQGRVAAGAGVWLMEWAPHALDPSGRRGNILNVFTDPAHRRRGLARRLTQTVLDHCRALGLRTFILHASHDGRAVYEAFGFKATNEMRLLL
jgi:ribosomal protein S18 acetylase RimI-like enzyme